MYAKDYAMLMKEIKGNLNKWRHNVFMIGIFNRVNMSINPRLTYRFNTIPIKIPPRVSIDRNKIIFKITWKSKGTRIAKIEKKKIKCKEATYPSGLGETQKQTNTNRSTDFWPKWKNNSMEEK